MNPKVDWYFNRDNKWNNELVLLRKIVLECNLQEELKWGVPTYTFQKSNILLIHDFKEYCAILFFKGALLKDAKGILVQQTKNVQSARQIRFTNTQEIVELEPILKSYIYEACEVEEAGLKVKFKPTKEFEMPEEFQKKLHEMPDLKTAFYKLSPGRQRGYLLYFAAAKQAKTREARIEKYLAQILDGKGLDD
jgi:uncharacterized protein YdeI (YjbR/CyaY-like superfamily)